MGMKRLWIVCIVTLISIFGMGNAEAEWVYVRTTPECVFYFDDAKTQVKTTSTNRKMVTTWVQVSYYDGGWKEDPRVRTRYIHMYIDGFEKLWIPLDMVTYDKQGKVISHTATGYPICDFDDIHAVQDIYNAVIYYSIKEPWMNVK